SRWEGLGLQLLEAQACGLPLVTTFGPPMAEYQPHRLIDALTSTIDIGGLPVPVHDARPDHLAQILRELWQTDVGAASRSARPFIEEQHSWSVNPPRLRAALEEMDADLPRAGRADRQTASPSRGPSSLGSSPPDLLALIPESARQVLFIDCGT